MMNSTIIKLFRIYLLLGLFETALSAYARRPGIHINTPLIGGRKADKACNEYASMVPTRVFPYMDIFPMAINGEFPQMAAVYGFNDLTDVGEVRYLVSGVLISPDFVISVAHFVKFNATKVRLGTTRPTDEKTSGITIDIQSVIVHPEYNARHVYNDISLIKLVKSVEFSYMIQPACLYTDPYSVKDIAMTAPGWGLSGYGDEKSNPLTKAQFTVIDKEECAKSFPTNNKRIPQGLITSTICAIDRKGDSLHCQGDSGSPLQFINNDNGLYTVVGISSFGIGCSAEYPGVFTNVTSYLDWIEPIVWQNKSIETYHN